MQKYQFWSSNDPFIAINLRFTMTRSVGCPRAEMVKPLDYGIVVSELELLWSYCCIATYNYTHIHAETESSIMTNEHTSLENYTSHTLFKRVTKGLCVRGELETEQTATYWPPVPLSLSALLSRSAQSGILRAHRPQLGAGSLDSILSPTSDSNYLNFLSHWFISL